MGTDVESQPMLESSEKEINIDSSGKPTELTPDEKSSKNDPNSSAITKTGLKVLALLAFQNCFKNILMRFVMVDHGGFLLSTAVIVVEILKLIFASSYIVFVNKQSVFSIITFIKGDMKNTILLAVPATSYSLQMTLEYVAFENLDPAFFSVLVQLKMLTTALFFRTVLKKRLMKKQIISLFLLTVGVMLCNMKIPDENNGIKEEVKGDQMVGILATLGIACSSGFASVYTEKVIKAARKNNPNTSSTNGGKSIQEEYGLAHMQAQLAIVSLVILGVYSCIKDLSVILEYGFFYNFNFAAFLSSLNSAVGGLIVAAGKIILVV